ncbi:amidohydrolase [Limibaculum sp. M0105]|uniref:Amidohydrolase n=2 Tax=Thermohalobaculum xanthum TaxID=2753746 RepID=A0A8J7M7M9_9RHOB|nr:amidohydrolase [Thermohalobaculum xanthum]
MAPELAEWRQDFHRHPELGYHEERTAARVASLLRDFGLDHVETGIGVTGVVGVLHGRGGPGTEAIMLRADMDALPMHEASGVAHESLEPGKMHACGHDGHTTMLLGAAKHLASTRNFAGTVYFCFQPAEEGGAGAKAMLDDGLLQRFPASRVFGMHNWPGMAAGHFVLQDGPVLASADEFTITVKGKGGHAAKPHLARDPIVAGAALVSALQSIVSRVVDPLEPAVVSITQFHAGSTHNVIPESALLMGTTRTFSDKVQAVIQAEMDRICAEIGRSFAVEIEIDRGPTPYPATVNDRAVTDFTEAALRDIFGDARVVRGHPPTMGSEDFAFLSREVPGCFVLIGNGDSAPLHHPAYDFSDEAAPAGVAFWSGLVERALPAG